MSEQAPGAQDTPAVGPEGTSGPAQEQPEVDWQDRYVNLQPEYTRATQEAAELRQWKEYAEMALTSEDEDTRRQAIEALGYALPEEEEYEPAEEYEDPYDELQAQIAAVQERLEQSDQQAQVAEENTLIRTLTDERLAQLEGLDEGDQDLVLAYAINALPPVNEPGVPVPLPDIQGAFEHFQAREAERQKKWAKTKRAPYVAPGGQSANEVPDLSTHQGRVDQALRKMAERDQA